MDFSAPQIVMVLIIALLVFGPKRLPELGRQLGRGVREMKRQMASVTDELTSVKDGAAEMTTANPAPIDTQAPPESVDDDDILDGVILDGSTPPGAPGP